MPEKEQPNHRNYDYMCKCTPFNTLVLKVLVIQQLICSVWLTIVPSVCIGIGETLSYCHYNAVFWCGLPQIVTGIIGFHFLWRNGWHQYLLIGYFVSLIVCWCINSYILGYAIFTAIEDAKSYIITVCVVHALNFVSYLAAFMFICCKWCSCCGPQNIGEDGPPSGDEDDKNDLQSERNPVQQSIPLLG